MFFSKGGIDIASESTFLQLKKNQSIVEAPARISGVSSFNVGSVGAFTFFRGGSVEGLKSIGRFCSVAPNIVVAPVEHDMRLLTTSTFINSWLDVEVSNDYWGRNAEERKSALRRMREPTSRNQQHVIIGNDVWIGQNVVIRKGVRVGNGAVIGANSVVSRDVEAYEVVGGAPAKHIKYRFSTDLIAVLERVQWWNWALDCLDGIAWVDPEQAAELLDERHRHGMYHEASYETLVY
ncbi:CatB-related O-acetyltransferase [Pseudomonas sp. BJa5]|uniref:CatB-related O-acetyltransferase n=1 Tax=Pseudomonas sp. BJa5 TaxID=2936270 RepID=UPI002559DFD5|nr:CatB-related O-acetyltransferase [Pseudomonas sp. BGr12]